MSNCKQCPSKSCKTSIKELSNKENKEVSRKVRATTLEMKRRRALGLCPYCGEKGKLVNLAFVCSKHGQYEVKPKCHCDCEGDCNNPESFMDEEEN